MWAAVGTNFNPSNFGISAIFCRDSGCYKLLRFSACKVRHRSEVEVYLNYRTNKETPLLE